MMTPSLVLSLLLSTRLWAGVPQDFAKLADDYWDMEMRLSPLTATYMNYPQYNDRLDDISASGRAEDLNSSREIQKRLTGIDRSALSADDKISYNVMKLELERRIEGFDHKLWQWAIDHMDGPQSYIPTVIGMAQPMKTQADAEALLARMKSIPAYFANYEANLREGLAEGRIAAKVPVEKDIAQIDEMLTMPPDKTQYAEAGKKLPADLQAKYMPQILEALATHVVPAYKRFSRFLKEDYLPKARPGPNVGLSGIPDGVAAYRYQIRYHTTVDMTPEQIHQIGLEELASIHEEMAKIQKRLHYKGALKDFLDHIRNDPANFFKTREEVLKAAQAIVARAKAKLPEFFKTLPKTELVVKPVEDYKEKNAVAAEYYPPPDDLSRPGIYYINTYKPESRPRFEMISLAAHEGVPGHHMQIALALERRDLPAFRRNGEFNAYVEGWALYCERLAIEMGLYTDDLSMLGMLSDQGLRASRLVVDTGLHAMGWSREQSIQFMKDNTALSEEEILAEVDRYIVWPGQALSYKIGQREIMALRKESQSRLGKKFDLRLFHDLVLHNGALPLSVLREIILGGTP